MFYYLLFFLISCAICLIVYLIFNYLFSILAKLDNQFIEKRKEHAEKERKEAYYNKQKNMQYNNWKNPYNTSTNNKENKRSENEFPECLKILGFTSWPTDINEIKNQYRNLAKTKHPDMGGSQEEFEKINKAYQDAQELKKYKS